jgi:hypothetical protein
MRGRRVRWGNVVRLGAGVAVAGAVIVALPSLLAEPAPPTPEPDVGLAVPSEPSPSLVQDKREEGPTTNAPERRKRPSDQGAPEPDGADPRDEPKKGDENGPHEASKHAGASVPSSTPTAQTLPAPATIPPAAPVPPPVGAPQPNPAGLEFGP